MTIIKDVMKCIKLATNLQINVTSNQNRDYSFVGWKDNINPVHHFKNIILSRFFKVNLNKVQNKITTFNINQVLNIDKIIK